MYTISSEDGPANPSIQVNVKKGDKIIGKAVFVTHSHELYEVHILPFVKEERGQTIRFAKLILKYMFDDLKELQKMIALIPVYKIHAIKIAEQAGFRYEGTITKGHLHLGEMVDLDIYGINREEVQWVE